MQNMLDTLVAWGLTCGLHFNPQKTVAMVFSRSKKVFDQLLVINDRQIPFSDSVKYLDLTLDKKLYWHLHMQDKIKKGKAFLMKITNVAREMWGPNPYLMRWAYTCVVRPMVIYACMIWAPALERNYIEKFRRLNRMAMNTYAPFPRSTPTRLLELLTDTFPLDIYVKKEGLCAYIRLQQGLQLTWRGLDPTLLTHNISHRKFWIDLKTELELDDITSIPSDLCDFRSLYHHFELNELSFGGDPVHLGQVDFNVYTDGSKCEFGVGSAYRIVSQGTVYRQDSYSLPSYTSVFQAEVHAIKKAAENLLMLPSHLKIKFFVDSQAALKALVSNHITSSLVKSTLDCLYEILNPIEFVWIKSHSGIEHNDAVDQLAKDASLVPDPSEDISPSRKFVRNLVIEKLRTKWDESWIAYPEARQSKIFYTGQDAARAKKACRLPRKKLSRLIRIVSGHNGLYYHRHNIDNSVDPLCRYCEIENESFEHFILRCQSFDADRQRIFQGRVIAGNMDWKIEELLEFSYLKRINDALTWRLDGMARPRAEVVIHTFSDSDSSSDDGESATADSVSSVITDYDSDDNVDEDLLNDNLDPVFQ